jgi:hypothetical protein
MFIAVGLEQSGDEIVRNILSYLVQEKGGSCFGGEVGEAACF